MAQQKLIRYVVCYDVTNDKRRRSLVKLLRNFGNRVQNSVFEAYLNESMATKLLYIAKKILDLSEDSLYLYPIGKEVDSDITRIGSSQYSIRDFEEYYIV